MRHPVYPEIRKTLLIVLRGMPLEIAGDKIKDDLENNRYPTLNITRMLGEDKKPAPLVLIQLDREYKSIFNIKYVCGLSVIV